MTDMDEYQDIKELLRPRRSIGASLALRQRVRAVSAQKHKGTIWFRSAAAAACIVLIVGAAMLFNGKGAVRASQIPALSGLSGQFPHQQQEVNSNERRIDGIPENSCLQAAE